MCMCVCVLVHGVLCFLPKFFWISWIRTWTFGKAFQYQFSQYMSDLSMERPLVDLSMSHYLHVVQHLMSRSGISVSLFPCCFFTWLLGGVCRQRQLNINVVQLAQYKNRFRGSGFCYCVIEASTFNLHLWYHYSFTFQ